MTAWTKVKPAFVDRGQFTLVSSLVRYYVPNENAFSYQEFLAFFFNVSGAGIYWFPKLRVLPLWSFVG